MTSKSKKDKIRQGNQRDFDLLYSTLVSGGTYSDYKSELLDRSMPQEMPLVITEDDILAAWILGKDEESELYASGGHIHQDQPWMLNPNNKGIGLLLKDLNQNSFTSGTSESDYTPTGLYSSDSGHNYTAGIPYVQQFDSLGGLGFNVAANANGASNDPYAKFIMGDTSGGFLQLMMSQKSSLREGANYIKSLELNFGVGDNAYLAQQYNQMQPIARSTMDADAVDTWKWIFDPSGIMHSWGLIDYDASEGQDYLNLIAEQVENRNKQNFNTAVTNSNKLNLWNQLSQPYMAACGGKMKNKLASGGYINSHYDYITDPLVKVDAGGTHQDNPNEGVLTSIAPDGEPNLVEEGETIINNGQDDAYVFSDRIVADEEILKSHLLPVKFAGKTYADISKELDKIIEEHKNDEISKRTFDEMISRLQQALEDQKYQEKADEVAKFIDGLSDEEKEQLEQTMVEEAQAEQQAAEEQAIAEQQAQELAAQEQQMQSEQAPEQAVMEQPEELIVPSRYDQMMSRALFADAANQGMFGLGGHINLDGKKMRHGYPVGRLPIHGTWNGFYDAIYKDKPLVTPEEVGTFGGGHSSGAGFSGKWGDVDYIKNEPIPAVIRSFDEAFAEARRNGLDTFRFNGKLYSTEVDPNYSGPGKKEIELMTPPMNVRKVYDNTGVELQDSTRVEPYFGQPIGWTERETINDKTKLKYIGSEPDWDNKKSKGGHLHQTIGNLITATKPVYGPEGNIIGYETPQPIQWVPENEPALLNADNRGWVERNVFSPITTYFGNLSHRTPEFEWALTNLTPVGIIKNIGTGETDQILANSIGTGSVEKNMSSVFDKTDDVLRADRYVDEMQDIAQGSKRAKTTKTTTGKTTKKSKPVSTVTKTPNSTQRTDRTEEIVKAAEQSTKSGKAGKWIAGLGTVGTIGAIGALLNSNNEDTIPYEPISPIIDSIKNENRHDLHYYDSVYLNYLNSNKHLLGGPMSSEELIRAQFINNGLPEGIIYTPVNPRAVYTPEIQPTQTYLGSSAYKGSGNGSTRRNNSALSSLTNQEDNTTEQSQIETIPDNLRYPISLDLFGSPVWQEDFYLRYNPNLAKYNIGDYRLTSPVINDGKGNLFVIDRNGIRDTSKLGFEYTSPESSGGSGDTVNQENNYTDLSTYLRYAPAIGSGIQYLSDLFGVTNRNNFHNADLYQRSINAIPNVGFTPLGNYMTYSPLDETYQQNVARSQYNAARRAIQNNASGNASAALAAMDSLNGNMNNTFGDLALQSRQYNDAQRKAVQEYNTNIAHINALMSLTAQQRNQMIAAEKARLTYNLAQMRQGIEDANDMAKSANFNNLMTNLGNIGRENYIMNQVNNNLAYYYRDNGDGTYSYKYGLTNAEREAAERYAKENGLTIK